MGAERGKDKENALLLILRTGKTPEVQLKKMRKHPEYRSETDGKKKRGLQGVDIKKGQKAVTRHETVERGNV